MDGGTEPKGAGGEAARDVPREEEEAAGEAVAGSEEGGEGDEDGSEAGPSIDRQLEEAAQRKNLSVLNVKSILHVRIYYAAQRSSPSIMLMCGERVWYGQGFSLHQSIKLHPIP